MSLGSLGSVRQNHVPRRTRRHGTHGLGKLTSPTEWTIASGEWPSTVSYGVLKSWTRWPELAYPGSGLTASKTTVTPWKVGQVLKLPPAWTPNAVPAAAPADALAPAAAAQVAATQAAAAAASAPPPGGSIMPRYSDISPPPPPPQYAVVPPASALAPATAPGMSMTTKVAIGGGLLVAGIVAAIVLKKKKG